MTAPTLPDYPGPLHTGLRWRQLAAADVEAWYGLVRRMAEADRPAWSETREDLAQYLASPASDPALTTLAGFDDAGTLRAAGRVSAAPGSAVAHTWGGVDPAWRRRGIGSAVYRWQGDCQRRRFAAAGIRGGVLRTMAEERNAPHNALLRSAGAGVVRYFTEMTRPLARPVPDLPLPAGFAFATLDPEHSEPVRRAHNEAFAGHWGSEPRDPARWAFTVRHPQLKPEWSMSVVETATGETVAYQLASFDPEYRLQSGYDEGFTDLLGVRSGWRGRGLASSLLAEAMRRFRAGGMAHAGLGVDTENASGALALYERMGYTRTIRSLAWDLPLA